MLIDFISLVLVLLSLFKGYRKGFVVAVFSFIAFILGLAAALKLSAVAADAISEQTNISQRWLPVLAFLAVFIVVVLLVRLGAKVIETAVRMVMLGWLNRLAGFFLYLLIYFFIFSIFLFYMVQLNLLKPAVTEASYTYPFIQPIAPKVMQVLSAVFPFLKSTFADLLHFFDNMASAT